jgi:hypothetical protein
MVYVFVPVLNGGVLWSGLVNQKMAKTMFSGSFRGYIGRNRLGTKTFFGIDP